MQAMIRIAPPQAKQVSMSLPNTPSRRCARVLRAAVSVRRLQPVPDVTVRRQQQALFRDRRPSDVATQPLELLALIRPRCHTGVQGDPGHLADSGIEGLTTRGQRLLKPRFFQLNATRFSA
jgi:hypothetical protein